ncbi:MAG TPA: MHYT domain-containing protein [Trichocoleus sp.]
MLASYAALDFTGHVSPATGWRRTAWLLGGAITLGIGIWSMHFVAMLALDLPVPVRYDIPTALVSALPAVLASGLALCLVSRAVMSLWQVIGGSLAMGLAIATMHYLGIAAMRLPGVVRYNLSTVAASILVAVAVSFVALWLAFCLRQANTILGSLQKVLSAVLMGFAIASMHYTGMAAMQFWQTPLPAALFPSLDVNMRALPSLMVLDLSAITSLIGAVAGGIIGIALLISLEARVVQQTALLQQLQQEVEQRQRAEAGLKQTLTELRAAQAALVQTEKMSSLGRLVAGVAHEVNNPLGFIVGNLGYLREFVTDLLELAQCCHEQMITLPAPVQQHLSALDLDFVLRDTPNLLNSMEHGASRIQQIVTALRNFSRLDEAELKPVQLTDGLEDALQLLRHRLAATAQRPEIRIVRHYSELPNVECYAGQLNQVFVKLLENAIDAVDVRTSHHPQIWQNHPPLVTLSAERYGSRQVRVRVSDNGSGVPDSARGLIFDPFFTTKPVGQGTGMGLAIAHQIVTQTHGGTLALASAQEGNTVFEIYLPLRPSLSQPVPAFAGGVYNI